jgi:hypothetical protein
MRIKRAHIEVKNEVFHCFHVSNRVEGRRQRQVEEAGVSALPSPTFERKIARNDCEGFETHP